jgi:methionine aminopeptidase
MSTLGYQTGIGPYWGIGLAPRNYVIQEGDVARIDGGGTHLGYISDISRTWVVGGSKPDQAQVDTYDALYAGFAKGLEMLGPGVKMKDLYAAIRTEVEKSSVIPFTPEDTWGTALAWLRQQRTFLRSRKMRKPYSSLACALVWSARIWRPRELQHRDRTTLKTPL